MKNSGPAQLRELLSKSGIVRTIGAHDVLTALLVEQAGFETVFIGGFGTSASLLGLPDVGFLTLTEMAGAVHRMAARVTIPVIADGDTGHGEIHNVVRTIEEFESAGASGILLEDQVEPKRCGHFEGKKVISSEDMVLKLRSALQARSNPDFVIIARTDAAVVHGLADAIDRANRYGDTGADIVFIEAPRSIDELERIAREVRFPMLVNMLTGGKTPILPAQQLAQMGFKIVVYPIDSLLVSVRAIRLLLEELKREGRVDSSTGLGVSFDEIKGILGLDEVLSLRDRLE